MMLSVDDLVAEKYRLIVIIHNIQKQIKAIDVLIRGDSNTPTLAPQATLREHIINILSLKCPVSIKICDLKSQILNNGYVTTNEETFSAAISGMLGKLLTSNEVEKTGIAMYRLKETANDDVEKPKPPPDRIITEGELPRNESKFENFSSGDK